MVTRNDNSMARRKPGMGRRSAVWPLCCTALGVLGTLAAPRPVSAETFDLGGGWELATSLDVSLGMSMRTRDPDKAMYSQGNGGTGPGTTTDDGNINYERGDLTSLIGKALGEVNISTNGFGVLVRGKTWYDYVTERKSVPHGSSANGYAANTRLDDSDFYPLAKFKGAKILDAYAYGDIDLGTQSNLGVKVGNHVVSWGEALFIGGGVNSYNIADGAAARRPGSQLKEILLPTPQASINLGLGDGLSLEAFYQLAWVHNSFEGCGTFWGGTDVLNCSNNGVTFAPAFASDYAGYKGISAYGGLNTLVSNAGTREAKNGGQFGFATRYFSDALGTDFGAYYSQYHAKSPIFSLKRARSATGSLYALRPMQYYEDFSAENIRVAGLSASTNLGGWSVGGEVSKSFGVPVQINTSDLVNGLVSGIGPLAYLNKLGLGSDVPGYDRKNKIQAQISTIKTFPNMLGGEVLRLLGEVAFQHWSGIGDPNTDVRYGRSPLYGFAGTSTAACGTSTKYCENKGYATSNSWGVRLATSVTYNDVFAGVNLTPRISVAWDVDGVSPDGTFNEDRVNVGFGVRADLLERYYADLSFSTYNHGAKYDAQRDHDFVALVVGATF